MPHANNIVSRTLVIAALLWPGLLHAAAVDEPSTAKPASASSADAAVGRGSSVAYTTPPDAVTVAVGGPGADMPLLLRPPVHGSGGVQGLLTVRDQSRYLLRLGAGWADTQTTRSAPPFQEGPVRRWNVEGSEFAWRHDGGEWYASMQRRHWGPGWTGSLILDGAAPPLPALGWRRPQTLPSAHPWLQWLGRWSADAFVGRLSGHDQPERPVLIGLRLQLQPFETLQFGVSRAMQLGGRGRDEGFKTILRALLGRDNAGTDGTTAENQPGNQLGGFDWRLTFGDAQSGAVYGQMIGEDENGYLPSAYIVQAGLETRWRHGHAVLHGFVEWNDLIAGHAYQSDRPPGITYRSGVYRRGYTQDGMLLGHPAGGDVTLASVGLRVQVPALQMAAVVSRGSALPTSQRFAAGAIAGLNATLQADLDSRRQLGVGLWWWRDTVGQQRALQCWWRGRF